MKLDTVINEMSHEEDPNDPVVHVPGGGSMLLSQLERNVRRKTTEISDHIKRAQTAEDWQQAMAKLQHGWMHAAVEAIVDAKREMEG